MLKKFTTQDLEHLLNEATPGPWTGIADEDTTCIAAPGGVLIDVDEHWSSCTGADVRLAAHAPAAVAEVIRLRKAIAELAEEERATADDEFFPVHLRDLCRAYADDLDRILEGCADE